MSRFQNCDLHVTSTTLQPNELTRQLFDEIVRYLHRANKSYQLACHMLPKTMKTKSRHSIMAFVPKSTRLTWLTSPWSSTSCGRQVRDNSNISQLWLQIWLSMLLSNINSIEEYLQDALCKAQCLSLWFVFNTPLIEQRCHFQSKLGWDPNGIQ